MRIALTAKAVKSISFDPNDRSNTYFDAAIRGFAVRVYASGAKSYLLKYREGKVQRMKVLGDANILPFEEARKRALKMLQELNEVSSESVKRMKMDEFCQIYMARHATPKKGTWKEDQRRIDKYIKPALGKLYLDQITEEVIGDFLSDVGIIKEFPIQANRIKEQLCKMFDLAKVWGKAPKKWENPARTYEEFEENPREIFLSAVEMDRMFESLLDENVVFQVYFSFLLMTGIRKAEALKLKWQHIYWDQDLIYSERSKNGRPAYYPLTEGLKMLLRELPQHPDNQWIFPGHKRGQHLVNPDKAWRRIRRRAGIEHVHIHDLRHTCGALLVERGESLPVIGKALNHDSLDSTKLYAHVQDKSVVKALSSLHQDVVASHLGLILKRYSPDALGKSV